MGGKMWTRKSCVEEVVGEVTEEGFVSGNCCRPSEGMHILATCPSLRLWDQSGCHSIPVGHPLKRLLLCFVIVYDYKSNSVFIFI